jgi:hypothetical protein
MMVSFARVVVGAAILFQSAATVPVRIGELAKSWTDSEAADIVKMVAPTGPAPWLLHGYHGVFTDGVEAYFSPDSVTKDVRRGALIIFTRSNGTLSGTLGSWAVYKRLTYAQVAVAGRNFDQVQGPMDVGRPFQINGNIGDSELTELVSFVRSQAGALPIYSITLEHADTATANLSKSPGSGQLLHLVRRGSSWIVSGTSYYIA